MSCIRNTSYTKIKYKYAFKAKYPICKYPKTANLQYIAVENYFKIRCKKVFNKYIYRKYSERNT